MLLNMKSIASMIDLSCVQAKCSHDDVIRMIETAKSYEIGNITTLQCFLSLAKKQIEDSPFIKLVGNVSFPSGSDSTSIKVMQAKELQEVGCDEIDMVINIGFLRSGFHSQVADDIHAVVQAVAPTPVKVIIEIPHLNREEAIKACKIVMSSGAAFVKTGTGWTQQGATVEDIKLIKSVVKDEVQIKASGGIRNLETLVEMYRQGARRFGVNLVSGKEILDYCISQNFSVNI